MFEGLQGLFGGAQGAGAGGSMFDLMSLFNTSGTPGVTGGMGGPTPGFLGLGDAVNGQQQGPGSIDPSVLAKIGAQASPSPNQQKPTSGGLGSKLSAGQITDPSQSIIANSRTGKGGRGGLSQFVYGK